MVGATELFNSISRAKPVWEASAIIYSLYISSALGVVLACQTSFLHSEHPPSSSPLNTANGLSADADNQGTCLTHKAAEGKKVAEDLLLLGLPDPPQSNTVTECPYL